MRMSAPTDLEREQILQFQSKLGDVLQTGEQKSESFLLGWIRARDGNLEKAETMLRTSMRWRAENGVDQILQSKIDPWILETYPFWVIGLDIDGRPVVELPLGAWDIRLAVDSGREQEFINYVTYFLESIKAAIRKGNNNEEGEGERGWPNTQFTIVVDWAGYSYSQLIHWKALQNTLNLASKYEAHYPELLHKGFFINCPSIFPLFMKMFRTIVAPKTLGKITCASAPEQWTPLVKQYVHPSQLGTQFGGTEMRRTISPSLPSHPPTI